MRGRGSRAEKIPDWAPGMSDLRGHLFSGALRAVVLVRVGFGLGVEGRAGLVTPAIKRSTSFTALSMERRG